MLHGHELYSRGDIGKGDVGAEDRAYKLLRNFETHCQA